MKKTIWMVVMVVLLGTNRARGQSVDLQEIYFSEFITFYISSIDLATGTTDVNLFELRIVPVEGEPNIRIEFRIRIDSPSLGLDYDVDFLTAITNEFTLKGAVRIRNTDLGTETKRLYYEDSNLGSVNLTVPSASLTHVDVGDMDAMMNSIIQSGQLPDGIYKFSIDITGAGGLVHWEREIIAAYPVALELIGPGGWLEDIPNTAISSTYPFFQWESDPCAVCSYRIRVARFTSGEHSSLEEAIEDQTVLPMNQAQGWYPEEDMDGKYLRITSLQYPSSDVIDLEPGLVYAWQIMKIMPTTIGDEEILSPIYAFKVLDPTASTTETFGPVLQFLQTVMGHDKFQAVFSADGDLADFAPTDVISINDTTVEVNKLSSIQSAVEQGEIKILSVEVE